MKVKEFFIKFNKITWWEILIIVLLGTWTIHHDWEAKKNAKTYVQCPDGSVEELLEKQSATYCGGYGKITYDPVKDVYYNSLNPKPYIIDQAIRNEINQTFMNLTKWNASR